MVAGRDRPSPACAFCGIVAGTIPSSNVYEDHDTLSFMDLRQPNPTHGGHVLVIPKRHIETIDALDDGISAQLMATTVRIARAMRLGSTPDGLSVWQSNGEAGGQEVPHVHFHVLARQLGDELLRVYPGTPPVASDETREALAIRLRDALT